MKWKRLMLEQPEIIQNDADLVREVKKIIEDAKPQCAGLASSHVEQMVRSLRGDFV